VRPLQAAVRGVDPHLDVEVTGTDTDWTATVVRRDEPPRLRRGRGHPGQHRRSPSRSSPAGRCPSRRCDRGTGTPMSLGTDPTGTAPSPSSCTG
jgi:hypothetical protein